MLALTLYLLTGIFAGILAGLLGVGGGVVVVPGLLYAFTAHGFPNTMVMHMAAATSLAAMVGTTMVSVYSHHGREAVRWSVFWKMLPGIIFGSILGVCVAALLSSHGLQIIFAIFLIYVALKIFFTSHHQQKIWQLNLWWLNLGGLAAGVSSGLLGIGGGLFFIPLLNRFGLSFPEAAGTSAACTVPVAIMGTLSFIVVGWHLPYAFPWTSGYIYWPAVVAVTAVSTVFVFLGAWLAKRLPVPLIRKIFAVLLLITAIGLIY